jgi:hypothetical protein
MTRVKRMALIVTALIIHAAGFSQNNAIFKGTTADGWNAKSYAQLSSSIVSGGNADGWAAGGYIQTSSSIYRGGVADGWASLNYLQSGTSLFKGGVGDGWASLNYVQASTSVFKGGVGDGWSSLNFAQTFRNIQTGGIGDGWAWVYSPLGPLPVTFISFTAQKEGGHSLLNWKTSQEFNSVYFDIERSNDAIHYQYIGRVSASGNSNVPVSYSFIDNDPIAGLNYYRIKEVDADGKNTYTPTRVVSFDGLVNGLVKYYPNPAIDFINIQLPEGVQGQHIVVNVININGIMMNQFNLDQASPSVFKIDVRRYAKGTYIIQVKSATLNSAGKIILQ